MQNTKSFLEKDSKSKLNIRAGVKGAPMPLVKPIIVEFRNLGALYDKLEESDARNIMSHEMMVKEIQDLFPRKECSKAKRHTLAFLTSRWNVQVEFELSDVKTILASKTKCISFYERLVSSYAAISHRT